jgi:hypothetical protein
MFTRAAAGARMPLMFAPLPSSVPPAIETFVEPEAIWIKGTVTDEAAARIVAPVPTRHSRELSTRPALLTV